MLIGTERFRLFLFFALIFSDLCAGQEYVVKGMVTDKRTGTALSAATVFVEELSGKGVFCNAEGRYAFSLPEGKYKLLVSYVGYETIESRLDIDRDVVVDFALTPVIHRLNEVVVSGNSKNENIVSTKSGFEKLQSKTARKIPVFFGEQDLLKTLTLTPGVKTIGDGGGGIFVRGGNTAQNLILLDDAVIYNANHLLGFFSTFNSDVIKDLTLYKGTSPAEYGGRLASLMDVRMYDGNDQSYHVKGGIGLISSRLAVEGPVVRNRGSFIVSGRRTYADLFLKFAPDRDIRNNQLNFYDLNAKLNYRIDEKNRIYLSGYYGRDVLNIPGRFGIDWGNATATMRWNHLWNKRLFSNTFFMFSDYDYSVNVKAEPSAFRITSNIGSYNLKHEFQFVQSAGNVLSAGYEGVFYTVTPGQVYLDRKAPELQPARLQAKHAWDHSFYFSSKMRLSDSWNMHYGIRMNWFAATGPGDFYTYDPDGTVTDSIHLSSWKTIKSYLSVEPRFNMVYIMDDFSSVKFSYNRRTQNVHLISNSTGSLPTDIWVVSDHNVKPEIADQVSAGFFHNLEKHVYSFSAEVYYKWMQNQIDLKNGADMTANQHIEGELLFGSGRAYGLEMLMKKETGKLSGWVGYTLSGTELKIPGINHGSWYPARHDATHDISVVGIYDLSNSLSLSGTWVYRTGNAVTFPSGKYEVDGHVRFYYTERNGYRMPAYHRLDLAATWYFRKKKGFESSLNFSIYNAYARKNAFSIDFEEDPDDPTQTRTVMTYLFTIMPSVTYNFKF